MGNVYVEVVLENYADSVLAEHGYMDSSAIRQETVTLLADSGATMLMLPQDLVERLGLRIQEEKVIVTYADERKDARPVAGIVTVRVGDRSTGLDCIVGPPASEGLLGQIILERLDLLVDCKEGRLIPRPESPYLAMVKLK